MIKPRISFLFLLILAFSLMGCGDDDDPTGNGTQSPGTLRVSLTDAPTPIEGVEALHITVSEVRVNPNSGDDGQWYDILPDTLTAEERTFDLLELANGNRVILGEEDLPPGDYEQIRLVVEESVVTVDGTVYPLKIPSGSTSGLKILFDFEVESDQLIGVTLDFDVGRSLIATPPGSTNFKLKPVIRAVIDELSGSISGAVLPTGIDAMVMAVSEDLADTATTYVDADTGDYFLGALLAGSWDVTALAPGHVSQTTAGVSVLAGEDTGSVDFTLEVEEPVEEQEAQ